VKEKISRVFGVQIGRFVKTKEGQPIGIVSDIVNSPKELKEKYPKDYKWLSFVALDVNKLKQKDWEKMFPLIMVDIGGERPYYIYSVEMKDYVFENKVNWRQVYRNILRKVELMDKEVKYLVHRTPKENLPKIMKEGLKPITKTGFKELSGQYSLAVGNKSKNFNELDMVEGSPNDVLIVYRKTSQKPLLKEVELNPRLVTIHDDVLNWYVSRETVKPSDIEVIYDAKGNVLYKKGEVD